MKNNSLLKNVYVVGIITSLVTGLLILFFQSNKDVCLNFFRSNGCVVFISLISIINFYIFFIYFKFYQVGVIKIYSNFSKASTKIQKSYCHSKKMKFFAIRGFPISLENQPLHDVITNDLNANVRIKILIIDPSSEEAKNRAKEFNKITNRGIDRYLDQIRGSIKNILDTTNYIGSLKCRLHNLPVAFRLLLLDDICLVGLYSEKYIGRNSPSILIKNGSLLYDLFERFFDRAWANSMDVPNNLLH